MYVVVQRTGFLPHFLYAWDGDEPRWLARKDIAKRFTCAEACRIANRLNARHPAAPIPVEIQPA